MVVIPKKGNYQIIYLAKRLRSDFELSPISKETQCRAAKAIVGEDSMTRCWRLQERGWDFNITVTVEICTS